MNKVQKAWTEATESEKRIKSNFIFGMSATIEQELYEAANCWAMINPKWKSEEDTFSSIGGTKKRTYFSVHLTGDKSWGA